MLRFIISSAAIYVAVGLAAWLLIRVLPMPESPAEAIFPPAFWLSTGLLIAASVMMQRAVFFVRLERQTKFRKSLLTALGLGASFVAIQSYGLSCMIRHQSPGEVETGANAFLTMLAALHAMHVTLALMLLIWVTLSAVGDRYDHEYYLGPLFCAWFWHGLGIVWTLIMIIFLIATNYLSPKAKYGIEPDVSLAIPTRSVSETVAAGQSNAPWLVELSVSTLPEMHGLLATPDLTLSRPPR